jgi:ribonuclease BN (tRNA processing enzyme)
MNSNHPSRVSSPVGVTILGSGDAFASGGRAQSAYIIESEGNRILLEAGPDVLRLLKSSGFSPDSIDLLIISHLHGDHIGGLPFLMLEYMWESPRKRPLTIVGPRNLEERVWSLVRMLYPNFDLSKPGKKTSGGEIAKLLKFVVLEPGRSLSVRKIKIRAIRSPHTKPDISLSLKIAVGGKTIVFSGDSGWNEELATLARGADLFLCECTYYESKHLTFHLNYPELVANRDKFQVGRMVLTHLGREVLSHQSDGKLNGANVELAFDGMKIEI